MQTERLKTMKHVIKPYDWSEEGNLTHSLTVRLNQSCMLLIKCRKKPLLITAEEITVLIKKAEAIMKTSSWGE